MSAYLIVKRENPILATEAITEYQSRTRKVSGQHKLIQRVVYGNITGLEDSTQDGVSYLSFPHLRQHRHGRRPSIPGSTSLSSEIFRCKLIASKKFKPEKSIQVLLQR